MLAFIYLIVFLFMVYKLPFFKDAQFTFKHILFFISIKIIGCLAYYWVYYIYMPQFEGADSREALDGAETIYKAIHTNVWDYIRMVFGMHSESEYDRLYQDYFLHINDWSQTPSANTFFLNDNRTVVRIHAIFRLFSFGQYAVHALFLLLLSFVGQFAFYKTFKPYFKAKEVLLMLVIFLTPSILFWSSGLLKEPLAIFILGIFIYTFFKLFVDKKYSFKIMISFLCSVVLFMLLKPYILILLAFPLLIFLVANKYQPKKIVLFYVASICIMISSSVLILKFVIKKDIIQSIVTRQNDFINLSNGGIFFINDKKYVRLDCKDKEQFTEVDSIKHYCIIKPHTNYMYWNMGNIHDTIFVKDNQDTSRFQFLSYSLPASSAIDMERLNHSVFSFIKLIPKSFINVLAKPFFYNLKSAIEWIASLENLIFALFFILCFMYRKKTNIDWNLLYLYVFTILISFLLIGLTTTVYGAIVRYKVPFLPFLLLIPLLIVDEKKLKKLPLVRYLL